MNIMDIVLIVPIAAAFVAALAHAIRSAMRGKSCCGNCSACSGSRK